MHVRRAILLACCLTFAPSQALAADFAEGSLIIPMDTDYQDMGMLKAYGLVYALLQANVPVHWAIASGKMHSGVDFTASATDVMSGADIADHGYRGGPWIVDADDVDEAMPIVEAWQLDAPETAVHAATAGFTAEISRTLVVAPSISMMADGNQKIARKYMLAAGIPDSTGDLNWPDQSPDMLDPAEISGPTEDNHHDGALFDEDGHPVYCQFMSMHWAVNDAEANPEVVAEMREFLQFPTHLFAECQAVNAFENLAPYGFFLTTSGFLIGQKPDTYDYYLQDTPFAQIDGPFLGVGGSEPAYTLPDGEMYKASDIVMITEMGTPIGVNDVWMTGFIDGICPGSVDLPDGVSADCLTAGKVSYLGGHEYDVDLPISEQPATQGTRLFLNSLFEAPCATAEGLPAIQLTKDAPASTDDPEVVFTLNFENTGPMPALAAVLTDTLPAGVTFVSATDNGAFANGDVTWDLGNLGPGEAGMVSVTVTLGDPGVYVNSASMSFTAGTNTLSVTSNETMTAFGVPSTTGGGVETGGTGMSGGTVTGGPGETGGTGGGTGGTGGSNPTPTTGGGGGSDPSSGEEGSGDTVGETVPGGCSCRGSGEGAGLGVAVLGLCWRRRKRFGGRAA